METTGRIIKGIGGFYYVETGSMLVECRARGILRSRGITPVAGDIAAIEYDESTGKGIISSLLERKNILLRPPVSNVDSLYIVVSSVLPSPSTLITDKLTVIAEHSGIRPLIVISKTDIDFPAEFEKAYLSAGYSVFETSADDLSSAEAVKKSLCGRISVFTGNSGVGKSTLINMMLPSLSLKTGEISQKLSRGKHTTRHTELYPLENGGYIVDTPGFSSIDIECGEIIEKEELAVCFPEFSQFEGKCRFPDCRHIGEKSCAVKDAVESGIIAASRYESYRVLYGEAEKIKKWDTKTRGGR